MNYVHTTKVGRFTVKDGGTTTRYKRSSDGSRILSPEQISSLERRAAIAVLREMELVSGTELKFARKALGLRQPELAEQLGVTEETVTRWENDSETFKRPVQLALLALLEHVEQGGSLRAPRQIRDEKDFIVRVAR